MVGLQKYQIHGIDDDSITSPPKILERDDHTISLSQSLPTSPPPPKFQIENTAILTSSSNNNGNGFKSTKEHFHDLIVQSMDVEQIERDVERCTWHLLTGTQRTNSKEFRNSMVASSAAATACLIKQKDTSKKVAALLKRKQRRLANLINLTLVQSYRQLEEPQTIDNDKISEEDHHAKQQRLRYYQGYHDVASIFLQVLGGENTNPVPTIGGNDVIRGVGLGDDPLGLDLAARVLCQVSYSHFRDNMRHDFLSLQTALKLVLYPLLSRLDKQVHNHLQDCDMEPFFCLSWILTWFSHDVRDTNLCKRLFDAFISSHPLLVVYVSLAMMLHPINRELILQTDCDFAAVHQCLASLPRNSCMVGWKRVPPEDGGGFVEDYGNCRGKDYGEKFEKYDADDEIAQSTSDKENKNTNGTGNQDWDTVMPDVAASVATTPSSCQANPNTLSLESNDCHGELVPFQALIDMAIQYMKNYPPRSLLSLARRYYRDESGLGMEKVPSIALLQHLPSWALMSTSPADWAVKQRLRQELGLKATSRNDRRKKAKKSFNATATPTKELRQEAAAISGDVLEVTSSLPTVDYSFLKKNANNIAVIAVGYGPGRAALLARQLQHKRLVAAVAVGVFATALGMVLQQYYATKSIYPPPVTLFPTSQEMAMLTMEVDHQLGSPDEQATVEVFPKEKAVAPAGSASEDASGEQNMVPTIFSDATEITSSDAAGNEGLSTWEHIQPSESSTSSPEKEGSSLVDKDEPPSTANTSAVPSTADTTAVSVAPYNTHTAVAKMPAAHAILGKIALQFVRFLRTQWKLFFGKGHARGDVVFLGGLRQWMQRPRQQQR